MPEPRGDPAQIETRLLVVAEMLDRAVAEVRKTMAEIKGGTYTEPPPAGNALPPESKTRKEDPDD